MRLSYVPLALLGPAVALLVACAPVSDEAGAAEQADPSADAASHDPTDAEADASASDQAAAGAAADPDPDAPPSLAEELSLPPGMAGVRWAEGLIQPVAMTFDAQGRLLVAEQRGRVWTLEDADGDGRADAPKLFAEGLGELRGITVAADGAVYLSERGQVSRAVDIDGDGVADAVSPIVRGLPGGLQANNGLATGHDGLLYIALGSTCNDCVERNATSASILVFDPATSLLSVYASGLRNPYDLVFDPDGMLWATDQGSQRPCASPDELNIVAQGSHYGCPYCASEDSAFPDAGPPVVQLGMETGASGIVWFESPIFAQEFRRGLFVALSTQARTVTDRPHDPQGPSVQFVHVQEDGSLTLRLFAVGFRRPIDVAVGPNAGVFVADAESGIIYRIGAPFGD